MPTQSLARNATASPDAVVMVTKSFAQLPALSRRTLYHFMHDNESNNSAASSTPAPTTKVSRRMRCPIVVRRAITPSLLGQPHGTERCQQIARSQRRGTARRLTQLS
eukprot:170253_1